MIDYTVVKGFVVFDIKMIPNNFISTIYEANIGFEILGLLYLNFNCHKTWRRY